MSSRKMTGTVISDKMQKTVVAKITRLKEHPLYHKKYQASKKIKVHDPSNQSKIGDVIEIEETKPISKDKSWKLVKIIKKGEKKWSNHIQDYM